MDAAAVRFMSSNVSHPAGVHDMFATNPHPSPPENRKKRAHRWKGVVDTMCTASYCGCSISPTTCMLYVFVHVDVDKSIFVQNEI